MKTRILFAWVLAVLVVAGCDASESAPVACLPKGAAAEPLGGETPPVQMERAPRATLYLDLSLSMVSYLDSRMDGGSRLPIDFKDAFQFGALVRRLPAVLKQSATRVAIAGFSVKDNKNAAGRLVPKYDITDDQFRGLTAGECFAKLAKGKPRNSCYGLYKGNMRTDFTGLFSDVDERVENGELVTIVSDLLSYDAGQSGDYNDVAGPLSGLIRKGYAVALLSAATGYNGDVADIPGGAIKLSGRIPFHIVIVGSSAQVAATLKAVEDDTGFRSFRQTQPKYWHAVLFDGKAGSGLTLGAPAIDSRPRRGVWPTGTGLVALDGFVGQFVVGRSGEGASDRQFAVEWPVAAINPLVPVEYRFQPDSQAWVHMTGGVRCEDGWQTINDAALRPMAEAVDVKAAGEPVRQILFPSGVPFQMASRATYLWRLGWKRSAPHQSSSEEAFLKTWSVNASGIGDLRTKFAHGEPGGFFPTFDLEPLYLDLWQAAYGASGGVAPSSRFPAFFAATVQ